MARIALFVITLTLIITCGQAFALSWTAFDVDKDYYLPHNPIVGPKSMTFTLENDQLTLDNMYVNSVGGSSANHWSLLFSGSWAVCGVIDSGTLVSDPYASFIQGGSGNGTIAWSSATPQGYKTYLMLGGSFTDNSAATYNNYYNGQPEGTTTGTLVLGNMFLGGNAHRYTAISHTFEVTNEVANADPIVPEPSAIIVSLWGLASLASVARRKRR